MKVGSLFAGVQTTVETLPMISDRDTSKERLFKVLGPNGEPCNGGTGSWHLPTGDRPGKWMPKLTNIKPCKHGYHVCTLAQLPGWLGPTIWEVEVRGERVDLADKVVVGQARLVRQTAWDERSARLFAADCAEHVLHVFEATHPGDSRPRDAITVVRRFAEGEATASELAAARAAARDAARADVWVAAQDSAWVAAQDSGWVAAQDAAWVAAQDAAWVAARTAAWDAARAAARDAEREWQAERLAHYLRITE